MTTSTLAGEYVTARELVGGRGRRRNFGTRPTCRRGDLSEGKVEEAMVEMSTTYVVRKRGRLTMELGVVMTRQNFGFTVPSWCSCCCARAGGTDVDTSAGDVKRG